MVPATRESEGAGESLQPRRQLAIITPLYSSLGGKAKPCLERKRKERKRKEKREKKRRKKRKETKRNEGREKERKRRERERKRKEEKEEKERDRFYSKRTSQARVWNMMCA